MTLYTRDPNPEIFQTRGLQSPEWTTGKGWTRADEFDFSKLPTLPELITGKVQGRTSNEEIICFINNQGLGYQYSVAGSLVDRKAKELSIAKEVPTEWFTENLR